MCRFLPYVVNDGGQNQIQLETESALALLIGLSREENSEPTSVLKVYYPFRVFTVEDEAFVFDLLGLSESYKRLLMPKDVSEILNECEKVENSGDKQVWLNTGITLLAEEQEYDTICIESLVERGPLVKFLLESSASDQGNKALFEPVFLKKNFTSTQRKLKQAHKEIQERIESNENTKKQIEEINKVIKESQEKTYSEYKTESEKKFEDLRRKKGPLKK